MTYDSLKLSELVNIVLLNILALRYLVSARSEKVIVVRIDRRMKSHKSYGSLSSCTYVTRFFAPVNCIVRNKPVPHSLNDFIAKINAQNALIPLSPCRKNFSESIVVFE